MRNVLVMVVAAPLYVGGAVACGRAQPPPPASRDAADASVDQSRPSGDGGVMDATPAKQPLSGFPDELELLDEPPKEASAGARIGWVSVPVGAREPRPIVIALHGGSDRPEWACAQWRGVANAYPFIVCPRGPGADSGLHWSSLPDTKARIARALGATQRTFSGWLRQGPTVLVGFSMGATQVTQLARSDPSTYPRVALSESAYDPSPAMGFAQNWAAGGGTRALFSCTTGGCEGPYRKASMNVAAYGVPARLNVAGTTQHGMWDVVVLSLRRDWPWLVEGLDGWEGYAPGAEEAPLPGRTLTFDPR
jgi:pimeloyl-ACP methyl ester carboxylesterase